MQSINLKLQGQFKFDLYSSKGELLKSSDYVDNFITNSGVLYPYHFAFADCFRYLSIGTSNANNSITSGTVPTTGLTSPLTQFSYIGGRIDFNSGTEGSNYAQPGNFGAGCGFINNPNGVSLVRQWNLPDNTGGVFTGSQLFREFMVTPGRPYVTGAGGVKFCSCFELDSFATGKDNSSTSAYYNWVATKYQSINHSKRLKTCDADKAFARVVYDFSVVPDSILTITYKLNIVIDTGIHFTSLFYNRGDAVANWNQYLNSYNSITQPGIALINDGVTFNSIAPNGKTRGQHYDYDNNSTLYSFQKEYGESFIPPMGAPLEPSNFFLQNDPNNQNVMAYISEDCLQFLVNGKGGALQNSGQYAPWNFWSDDNWYTTFSSGDTRTSGNFTYKYIYINPSSGNPLTDPTYWLNLGYIQAVAPFNSGIMPFRNDNDVALFSGSNYWSVNTNLFNIRRDSGNYPSISDITSNTAMASRAYTSPKASLPNLIFNSPFSGTRNASVVYTYSFENYSTTTPLLAKSMVLGYKDIAFSTVLGDGDRINIVPFFDSVFSGISGNTSGFFIPGLITGILSPGGPTGAMISGAEYIGYNDLESASNSLYPIINTSLTWSVPCPNGVDGC